VKESGTYALKLSYGCRPLDAGGVLKISSRDSATEHTVQATTTAEQFELFEAGKIKLAKGEVEMKAEIASAPGREIMRLNKIFLERVK
jgi:hypothetical protein